MLNIHNNDINMCNYKLIKEDMFTYCMHAHVSVSNIEDIV